MVDASNLQRQILHGTSDLGRPKIDSGADTIRDLNPDVEVAKHCLQLDSLKVLDLFNRYDTIIDGADNFPTRNLANQCDLLGKPLVHGSIYRCLFEAPPPPDAVPVVPKPASSGAAGDHRQPDGLRNDQAHLRIGKRVIGRLLLLPREWNWSCGRSSWPAAQVALCAAIIRASANRSTMPRSAALPSASTR